MGKGQGDRAYQHSKAAIGPDRAESRIELKLDRIRKIHERGRDAEVEIVRHGLSSEEVAFEVEAAVIDVFRKGGTKLTNVVAGHGRERGWLPLEHIEAKYAAEPVKLEHRVLLIRLRVLPETEEELYRRTRKWWKLDRQRAEKVELALAVYDGVVRAVYRVDRWERPTAKEISGDQKREGRWGFRGHVDRDMERLYLLRDVRSYLPRGGGQNPIKYVNC